MFFTTLLAFGLRLLLVWENKKLDRQYGSLEEQKRSTVGGGEIAAEENYGPAYRYVL